MKNTELIARTKNKFASVCTLTERDMGEYAHIQKNGMKFHIRSYEAEGLGYLSTVEMSAMLGLMKMDSLIFTPVYRDAPLYSFDRILAMGKDSLLLELYDLTITTPTALDALSAVKSSVADIPDNKLGERWYDYLKLPPSLSKRGKKLDERYRSCTEDYTDEYIKLLFACPECDREEKLSKIDEYVTGLFEKGAPTTEQFEKLIGREKAEELYSRFVFSSRPD